MWLIIHAGIKVNPCWWKGPRQSKSRSENAAPKPQYKRWEYELMLGEILGASPL